AWAQRCTSVSARSSGGGNFVGNGMTRPRLAMAGAQYNAVAMPVKVGVVGDYDPGSRAHRATDAALAHAAGALSLAVDVRWPPTRCGASSASTVSGSRRAVPIEISRERCARFDGRESGTGPSWPPEGAFNILC